MFGELAGADSLGGGCTTAKVHVTFGATGTFFCTKVKKLFGELAGADSLGGGCTTAKVHVTFGATGTFLPHFTLSKLKFVV
ncbi:hypothetical protein [Winogradskyella aurantia]|uniref:Uncharacterized protein n=1 Tax=Winogradskyella aurantia TaxID=1915063 RepID=A0A265UWR7_9FLAO|nr:hypothetical protein [Winogradskyella aurantia]OZV69736.1 hypothetical protein CA834_03690 [Winogradskyella aurantia]